jgi:putative sigma-54 modulation protein
MEIKVTGRHPDITPHVKAYVEDKTHRLERYFDGTHRIEVIISKDAEASVVEILIAATGRQLSSKSKDPDIITAFDAVLDKAEKQLIRYKEKLRERRSKATEEGSAPASSEEE